MLSELLKYLKAVRNNADIWERTTINGQLQDGVSARHLVWISTLSVSVVVSLYLPTGLPSAFVAFSASVLAILIGLFISALVFSFDKFYNPDDFISPDHKTQLWKKQAFNYAKKFVYVTGQTIVLGVFALAFLAPSALFETALQIDVSKLSICTDCISTSNTEPARLFLWATFARAQRFVSVYLLLRVGYNTLYIVSSMVQFMVAKIDRKK